MGLWLCWAKELARAAGGRRVALANPGDAAYVYYAAWPMQKSSVKARRRLARLRPLAKAGTRCNTVPRCH